MNSLRMRTRYGRSLAGFAVAISGGIALVAYADVSADIALLRARANLLDEAAQGCESSVNPAKCRVSVTWENGRQISASAATSYAQSLRARASELETYAEMETLGATSTSVPQSDSESFGSPGSWTSSESQTVRQIFGRFERGPLFDFIRANVRFKRRNIKTAPGFQVGSSDLVGESDGILYFYDPFFWSQIKLANGGFLSGDSLDVRRTNLMAFDTGKATYSSVKNRRLPNGQIFGEWFEAYAGANESQILATNAAAYKRGRSAEGLIEVTSDLPGTETENAFGCLFRGAVLKVEKPREKRAREQYDSTMNDFQTRLNWVLVEH